MRKFKSKIIIVILITFITTLFTNTHTYAVSLNKDILTKAVNVQYTDENAQINGVMIPQAKPADLTEYNKALNAVDESNCEAKSWARYQKVVAANVMTTGNTQLRVNIATGVIKAAQYLLEVDFTAYNTLLSAVSKDGYTQDSWLEYQKVVNKNKVNKHSNAVEVTAAARKIKDAQGKLEADLTEYNKALNAVVQSDYTIKTWTVYQEVVKVNVVTAKNTPAQVKTAKDAIIEAQKNLVRKADLTEYNKVLAAATQVDYTVESWTVYQEVVNANIVTEENTVLEVTDATQKIKDAQKKLVFAGKADLDEAKRNTPPTGLASEYTYKSWNDLKNALNLPERTNTEVVAKTVAIKNAVARLITKVAYNDLIAAKNLRNGLAKRDYTDASWAILVNALNLPETTNSEMLAKIAAIRGAIKGLVFAGQANLDKALLNANSKLQINYTEASWTILMNTLNLTATTNAGVVAKTTAINNAIAGLVIETDLGVLTLRINSQYSDGSSRTTLSLNSTDYTEASWLAYTSALEEAINLEKKQGVLQSEVNNGITVLDNAIDGLVFAGTANLNVAKAKASLKLQADYTVGSWSVLTNALLSLPETTNAEVVAKTTAINNAIDTLVFVGKANLDKALLSANSKLQADYTAASWNVLVNALALPETTNAEVIAKTATINNAINTLVFAGKSNLDVAKKAASTKVQVDYTVESWIKLKDALALPERTNAEVVAKTIAINNAISGLKPAAVKYKVVAYNGLNCRVSPNINSNKVRVYTYGTILEISEIVNGWGRTQHGWVNMQYVTKAVAPVPVSIRYRVTPYIGLNCRVAPSINSAKVTAYTYGTILEISEIINGWGNTQRGWVCMQYLKSI